MLIPLAELNAMDRPGFVSALDGIYEHSPWVAEAAIDAGPFTSRLALLDALNAAMFAAPRDTQLALIRAHPELAGKAAIAREMTEESVREQTGAGLDRCTAEEFERIQALNGAYRARFGFPFIIAVKGHSRASIIAAMAERLLDDEPAEFARALHEISRIAAFRLVDRISEPAGDEIVALCARLAWLSEQSGALTCTCLTPVHQATAALLRDWMLEAGLDATIDAIGNVVGRWPGFRGGARTLITGSHYDTVINGGHYDGRLGIVLPIVAIRRLRQTGTRLPFDVEIVAFSDEEGVRFQSTFLGSSALAGHFDPMLLARRDRDGISLADALQQAGHDPATIPQLARDPARVAAFVEVHIEQGPVLLDEGRALGVVTAINGAERHLLSIRGLAGHAGTVPMRLRRDAAAAAAELVLAVEQIAHRHDGVVATVGTLTVPDGAINVIPGRCELSIDLRAPDDALRAAAAAEIGAAIAVIAARRRVEIEQRKVHDVAATPCDPALQRALAAAVRRTTDAEPARHLPSGAGHDAMMMARLAPVAMLFVRCGNGGISHHPEETMTADDAQLAAAAFIDFLTTVSVPA
ncbi:MAG: allantoate amidohydrolase [Xanthomonadaceae bacterium]|nr:allantoate amidohydrolase [Xanthomonadaceae bacterium]